MAPAPEDRKSRRAVLSLTPVLLVLLLLGGCGGCQKQAGQLLDELAASFGEIAECPSTDATPPAVQLVFDHPVTGVRTTLASGAPDLTIAIQPNDRFFVTAIAEDPEGVADLKIFAPSAPVCESAGDIGCKVGPGLTVPSTISLAQPTTRLWLPYQVAVHAACPEPCKLTAWNMTVHATASNCAGLEGSSPTLKLTTTFP